MHFLITRAHQPPQPKPKQPNITTNRFDLPSGTLPLLTAALGSGCWPLLESLDASLDLLALDAFASQGLLQEGCVRTYISMYLLLRGLLSIL